MGDAEWCNLQRKVLGQDLYGQWVQRPGREGPELGTGLTGRCDQQWSPAVPVGKEEARGAAEETEAGNSLGGCTPSSWASAPTDMLLRGSLPPLRSCYGGRQAAVRQHEGLMRWGL